MAVQQQRCTDGRRLCYDRIERENKAKNNGLEGLAKAKGNGQDQGDRKKRSDFTENLWRMGNDDSGFCVAVIFVLISICSCAGF